MTTHDRVRQQLHELEALLREHHHWRMDEPEAHLFSSTQPFCMDTMEPIEWLQWVLIPVCMLCWTAHSRCPRLCRCAVLRNGLECRSPLREILLEALQALDAHFAQAES